MSRLTVVEQQRLDKFAEEMKQRNDGYGWGLFIFTFLLVAYVAGDACGWPVGLYIFISLMIIWELGYRLSTRSK